MIFYAADANELYLDVLRYFINRTPNASPRGLPIVECLAAQVHLEDTSRCLVSLPARKLNYHFAVAEWWWIATGREDVQSITPYCENIRQFSDDGFRFFGAYGPKWHGQVYGSVVTALEKDPDSRQAVINIWRENPKPTKDYPCTLSMQYVLRGGKLHAIVTMRSWDVWLGLPYDVHNFAQLQNLVAGELGVERGSLTITAGSMHLYERDRDKATLVLAEYPHNVWDPPALPPLPGLIPGHLVAHPMDIVDWNVFPPTSDGSWESVAAVLRHRHFPHIALPSPYNEFFAPK